jgi:hypothetical protein
MEHSNLLIIPKHLRRKVTPFLKKMPDTTDIKVNIAILEFDQVWHNGFIGYNILKEGRFGA